MRTLLIAIVLSFVAVSAFGYTFILNNGKRIEGRLLVEEKDTIRIEDTSGIPMTLKKSSLNWEAMDVANLPEPEPEVSMEPAASYVEAARPEVRVFTNASASGPLPGSEKGWLDRIRKTEREYAVLKEQCRNAGTGPTVRKNLETHVYRVNGKAVTVTGYWAHPESVARAKQICQKAIRTELALQEARKGFEDFRLNRSSQKSGSGSGSSLR